LLGAGVLLSGGLDSSLTASIAARAISRGRADIHAAQLHSFTIALDAHAPDAIAARDVARMIGSEHHEVHFTVQEGIDSIEQMVTT
jgi:asparagine synthase (glutamine-hydrolysing)